MRPKGSADFTAFRYHTTAISVRDGRLRFGDIPTRWPKQRFTRVVAPSGGCSAFEGLPILRPWRGSRRFDRSAKPFRVGAGSEARWRLGGVFVEAGVRGERVGALGDDRGEQPRAGPLPGRLHSGAFPSCHPDRRRGSTPTRRLELSRCARSRRVARPTGACGPPTPRHAVRGSSGRRTRRPAP